MIPIYKKFGLLRSASMGWDEQYAAEGTRWDAPEAYAAQRFVQVMLRHLMPGQRLLDAGCGTGGLARFFHGRGLDVTGIDTSAVAIRTLRAAAPEIRAEVADLEVLPIPDASFDAYAAIGSWEYPPNGPARAAAEAARVLKTDGLAFIEVPHVSLVRRLAYVPLKRLEFIVRRARGSTPHFSHYLFTRGDLRSILERTGFTVLAEHPHDLPEASRHYGLSVDWPFLRARPAKPNGRSGANPAKRGARSGTSGPYEINTLGRLVKRIGNALSPWTISTGMFIVAQKKTP